MTKPGIIPHFPTVLRARGRGGVSTTQSAEWLLNNVTFSDAVTRAGTTKYLQEIKTIKKQSIENVPIKKTVRNQVFQLLARLPVCSVTKNGNIKKEVSLLTFGER